MINHAKSKSLKLTAISAAFIITAFPAQAHSWVCSTAVSGGYVYMTRFATFGDVLVPATQGDVPQDPNNTTSMNAIDMLRDTGPIKIIHEGDDGVVAVRVLSDLTTETWIINTEAGSFLHTFYDINRPGGDETTRGKCVALD